MRCHKAKKGIVTFFSSEAGFTVIEAMIVSAMIGILASLATAAYEDFGKRTRDGIRKLHLAQYARMIKSENFANGSIPQTFTYGEAGAGSWDYSSEDRNGNGMMFLDFLGPQNALDSINRGTPFHGGDTSGAEAGTHFAYAFYCYSATQVANCSCTRPPRWGPGPYDPNGFAVLFTKLELSPEFIYYVRIDGINCG